MAEMMVSFGKTDEGARVAFHASRKDEIDKIIPGLKWTVLSTCESATVKINGIEVKFFT